MNALTLARIEQIVLLESDYIEVRDAVGGRIQMTPITARALHRELGKFLAMENDGKPLPQPTRGDFKNLLARVEKLERQASEMFPGTRDALDALTIRKEPDRG